MYPFQVTVCIAALCENRRKIVFVSDTKFSFGGAHSADDIAIKAIEIHSRWSLLFAGDDVPSVPFVVARAKLALEKIDVPTPEQASSAVDEAHRARLHKEIEVQVLRPFGYSMKTFLKHGKQQLTEDVYGDVVNRMTQVRLSVSFIVAGFDAQNKGHLFVIDGDHSPADHTPVGFCAIGSGYDPAVSTMSFNARRSFLGVHSMVTEMVYGICEAKSCRNRPAMSVPLLSW